MTTSENNPNTFSVDDNLVPKETNTIRAILIQIKDLRQLSWMSHGVTPFWFILNFFFISAFFDIIVSLSISLVFQAVLQADENSPAQVFPEQLLNLII